jgi:hypothetical protein
MHGSLCWVLIHNAEHEIDAQSCVQLRKGPPKTLLEQQSAGIQFHDNKPKDGSGSCKDEDMSGPTPEEDSDTQYARRVQAKLDAAKYAHSQRGCEPPTLLRHISCSTELLATCPLRSK